MSEWVNRSEGSDWRVKGSEISDWIIEWIISLTHLISVPFPLNTVRFLIHSLVQSEPSDPSLFSRSILIHLLSQSEISDPFSLQLEPFTRLIRDFWSIHSFDFWSTPHSVRAFWSIGWRLEVSEWVNGSESSDWRVKGSEISDLISGQIRRLWPNEGTD